MSDQSQTTAKPPSEPVLCKMGCGFFGNSATGGCCSKCFLDKQKKDGVDAVAPLPILKKPQPSQPADAAMADAESIISDHSEEVQEKKMEEQEPVETAPKKKKGKKKLSYKSMMADMMHTQSATKAEKEKEALRNVTGGGAFTKIEKI